MEAADVELASEDILNEPFLQRMRHQAGDALKRAISKVLGLFDAQSKLIFIDQSVPPSKQTFLKLHETGHAALPWQNSMYTVIEDCKQTIAPDISGPLWIEKPTLSPPKFCFNATLLRKRQQIMISELRFLSSFQEVWLVGLLCCASICCYELPKLRCSSN
jgi:hypothetical protein